MKRALGAALMALLVVTATPAAQAQAAAGPPKVLRYAFPVAETGFDPSQISDIYSRIVTAHIFEAPLSYDHLARPYKIKPSTAVALPEISDDYKTFVFRIKPGIYFADDPAFKGKKRELVAEDYVYSLKRVYDPKVKSPVHSSLEDEGIVGLQALRDEALKSGKPFDYDREVEGLKALDRYTFRVKLRQSRPRHLYSVWVGRDVSAGAVAREVVEFYGDRIMEHPVGTGPFRLVDWRRSSKIVLERNPNYREDFYDAEPNADDADGQALLQRFKGKRLPMIDRVEVSIIEQSQPRWLSFLNGEQSFIERLPNEFADQALPGGKLAPHLAKRGVQAHRVPGSDVTLLVFNMENPARGGGRLHAAAGGPATRHRAWQRRRPRDPARAARPGHPGAVDDDALHHRLLGRPAHRDERVQPGPRPRPARPLRLGRPQRRRLARAPRWLTAGDRDAEPVRRRQPPARRALQERHGRARPAPVAQGGAVAREPEGCALGPVHDLARGLVGRLARRPGFAGARLRSVHRQG
jgi:hypothetical protein